MQFDFNPADYAGKPKCELKKWVIDAADKGKRNEFLFSIRPFNMQSLETQQTGTQSQEDIQNHGQLSPPDDPIGMSF